MATIQKQIYSKDIERNIEGVIKADDKRHIAEEINEYVITDELAGKSRPGEMLPGLFAALAKKDFNQCVWISGDFGSGKSHLLKILSYVLGNETVKDENGNDIHPSEVFEEKAKQIASDFEFEDNVRKVVRIPTMSILFNIQAEVVGINSNRNNRDKVLEVFMKVFNEKLGYDTNNFAVAEIEREIDKRGKYQYLKDEYKKRFGKEWIDERSKVFFKPDRLGEIYADIFETTKDEAVKNIRDINNSYSLSIKEFAKIVKSYLDDHKKELERIVFFVDEIGQFIADDENKMLSVQTIAEELGKETDGHAFVMVTSQVDLKTAIGQLKKKQQNDFSRIQGRFSLKINLTSANADEVIQKRLLQKKDEYKAELKQIYEDNKEAIKVLFNFGDASRYKTQYKDAEQFVDAFPFINYQFSLLKKSIVELSNNNAFSGTQQSVGERSMLSITQRVAQQYKDCDLKHIVQFCYMYEGVKPILQTRPIQQIIQAENSLDDELAIKVLKTLFLVRYVDDFSADVDTIAKLLLPTFDTDIVEFKKQIKEALNKLVNQTYVERLAGDKYSFLTDVEKDIENQIKSQDLEEGDVIKELNKIFFDDIYSDRKIRIGDDPKKLFSFGRYIDGVPDGKEQEIYIHFITPANDNNYEDSTAKATLSARLGNQLVVFLGEYPTLQEDLTFYLKSYKKLNMLQSQQNDELTRTIIYDKTRANTERRRDIVDRLRELVGYATLYVNGNELNDITAHDVRTRLNEGMQKLIESEYVNLKLIREHKFSLDVLHQTLNMTSKIGLSLEECDSDVLNAIQQDKNQSVRSIVSNIISKFRRTPYGWYEEATECILAKLYIMEKIAFYSNSSLLEKPDEIVLHLTTQSYQQSTIIKMEETISPAVVRQLKNFYQEFSEEPCTATEAKEVHRAFHDMLADKRDKLRDIMGLRHYNFVKTLQHPVDVLTERVQKQYPYYYQNIRTLEDELLDIKENEIDPVLDFISGPNMKTFEKMELYEKGDQTNLNYVDSELKNNVHAVYVSDKPWKLMVQATQDVAAIGTQILNRLATERNGAKENIKGKIDALHSVPGYQDIPKKDQQKAESQLSYLLNGIDDERYIANLVVLRTSHIDEAYDRAIQVINDAVARMQPLTPPTPPSPPTPDNNDDTTVHDERPDKPKSKKVIHQSVGLQKAMGGFRFSKPVLENSQDVDEYVKALRKQLMQTINNNKNIIL
nr:BREX system P-loop protein BrxC [uncultured Prevotella sp.]